MAVSQAMTPARAARSSRTQSKEEAPTEVTKDTRAGCQGHPKGSEGYRAGENAFREMEPKGREKVRFIVLAQAEAANERHPHPTPGALATPRTKRTPSSDVTGPKTHHHMQQGRLAFPSTGTSPVGLSPMISLCITVTMDI